MRACPLTTQTHSNPACSNPGCRPELRAAMCPACGRILHGRFVDLVEYEHRFMHERGACSCDIRFPNLQQPRMVTYANTNGNYRDSPASSSTSGTDPIVPANAPATARIDGGNFAFSPSAAAFTPSGTSSPGPYSHFGQVPAPVNANNGNTVNANNGNTANANNGNTANNANNGNTWSTTRPCIVNGTNWGARGASPDTPGSQRPGKAKRWKNKSRVGQASGSPPNGNALSSQPKHTPPPPDPRRLSMSVRMSSLYAAEWAPDHAELHRTGRCSCPVIFERYTGYPEAAAAIAAESNGNNAGKNGNSNGNGNGANGTAIVQYSENDVRRYDPPSRASNGWSTRTNGGNSSTNTSGYQTPNASTYVNHHSSSVDNSAPCLQISNTVHQYWGSAPVQPTFSAAGNGYQYPPRQGNRPQNGHTSDEATPHAPGAQEYPDATADDSLDVQMACYQPTNIPIVGLPIGAGPEGDSHMPPFEDCELYYPKLRPDQRPASAPLPEMLDPPPQLIKLPEEI
ncbi:hypothetical protein F5Y11DRAFT_363248 [Daldinia sp. FL1419]|nr:hypothetical protein F5Y11DRAFT_363248 [Daldinia sp. FL1419]